MFRLELYFQSIAVRVTRRPIDELEFLKPGCVQVAAGYVVYGSSTMFVYTTGQGVHGFTLDPEIGEFVLSHESMKIPDRCKYFSANDSNYKPLVRAHPKICGFDSKWRGAKV